MRNVNRFWLSIGGLLIATTAVCSAGTLTVVKTGKPRATIVASSTPGPHEKLAVEDLVKYVEMMSGATLAVANTAEAAKAALAGKEPVLLVGQAALEAKSELREVLAGVAKKEPIFCADAIVLRREGNRVYIAGNNDLSHYFAVAALLRQWGCRWFMPTQFGECIPESKTLKIRELDVAYGPPFEVRSYWISWCGSGGDRGEFKRRNMMTPPRLPRGGHSLGGYVKGYPGLKHVRNMPFTDPKLAEYVAAKAEKAFAAGKGISLAMVDGLYGTSYPGDQELLKLQWDKYFMRWSVTDLFMVFYNNVARILQKKHPESQSKMLFLAYNNMTIPPVRKMTAEPSLFCKLAAIDIDPIHGMDDPQSPPRQEYKEFVYKWAKVMQGRISIYDYDQSMLVWRDLPNPSHQAFRQDVQHYRKAGVVGIDTECRSSMATVFINLYLRARLMWNPDGDVDALLDDFYARFYGPAAEPMREYWSAIFQAWKETIVTEHEYFVIPAIYTPELVALLETELLEAEKLVAPLKRKPNPSRNEKLYLDRMSFTRMSYDLIDGYTRMIRAAGTECDYPKAVEVGRYALKIRDNIAKMNVTFVNKGCSGSERGPAWWPGEVKQYGDLASYTDGTKGTLLAKLPLEWAFHRDPDKTGLEKGYAKGALDLVYWKEHAEELTLDNRKDYPVDQWEMLRTDLYMQAQGVRHPDRQSYTGYGWYRTEVNLGKEQATGPVHIRFPGLFNECRLYVNGSEVAHRKQEAMWWWNDYRFEWDVDLTGKLKPGANTLTLLVDCVHHMGGMFRRPFLYRPVRGPK